MISPWPGIEPGSVKPLRTRNNGAIRPDLICVLSLFIQTRKKRRRRRMDEIFNVSLNAFIYEKKKDI